MVVLDPEELIPGEILEQGELLAPRLAKSLYESIVAHEVEF